MLFTGIVFTLIGIMARTYAGIFEIHDSTWKAMKASIVKGGSTSWKYQPDHWYFMYHCILCIEMETAE